jgi:CDP-glycerol glycerophosphotransferase (TagB/SpsB family)
MSSHKCNNGSGRKRNGKAEKHNAKYLQALRKYPKPSGDSYEPSISIMESTSSTSANEDMHYSTSDSQVQLNANQLRQLRKINRRRVISNAEIALRRNQLRDTGNQNLTVNELVELLEPEPDHEPAAIPAAIAPLDNTSPSIVIQNAFQKMGDWRSYTLEVMDEACIPGGCCSF